ncbi:hypothetical protein BGZ97_001565, partial [Linnemannia gamsii]
MVTPLSRSLLRPGLLRTHRAQAIATLPHRIPTHFHPPIASPNTHRTLATTAPTRKSRPPCGPGCICDHTSEKEGLTSAIRLLTAGLTISVAANLAGDYFLDIKDIS